MEQAVTPDSTASLVNVPVLDGRSLRLLRARFVALKRYIINECINFMFMKCVLLIIYFRKIKLTLQHCPPF